MFYTYILFSVRLNRYYIGTTDDVVRRLEEHNNAFYEDAYTSKGIPWNLLLLIVCDSSSEAYRLEAFIKRMKSRKFIEKLLVDPELVKSIRYRLSK
jgi:putative endonuclease